MINVKELENLIPDENIRSFVLEGLGDTPFTSNLDYYNAFQNIINLAFIYAYACYLDLKNRNFAVGGKEGLLDRCIKRGNANTLRVIRTMDKIYAEYPITNELIQFTLMDIQFDYAQGKKAPLREFFPHCYSVGDGSVQLGEYFNLINMSLISSRNDKIDLKDLDQKLYALIGAFPFLSKAALEYSEERGWYVFNINGNATFEDGKINTYGIIARIKASRITTKFYFLSSIEKDVLRYENSVGSKYCKLAGDSDGAWGEVWRMPKREGAAPAERTAQIPLKADPEQFYSYICPSLLSQNEVKKNDRAFDQLFNINYKYVKNLALAISDALDKKCCDALVSTFRTLCPDAFSSYEGGNVNWDTVVVMLLIEASPSRVLKAILQCDGENGDIGYTIICNLRDRFGKSIDEKFKDIDDSDDLREKAKRMVEFKAVFSGKQELKTASYDAIFGELLAEAKAAIILSAFIETGSEEPYRYSNRILQSVESLEVLNGNSDPNEICSVVLATLGVVLKRLSCFYSGLYAYGRKKIEYDKKSEWEILPSEVIQKYQLECEESFRVAAKREWDEVVSRERDDSILDSLNNFIKVCEKCENKSNSPSEGSRTLESRCLYEVIGRYVVLDIDLMKREINYDSARELSPSSANWWRERAIKLLRFFAIGSFEAEGDIHEFFQDAIAPTVASFFSFNNSKDGYDAATLYLTIDINGNDVADFHREINVLSEFSFDMHSKYYCLPNVVRANDKWWVEPFIIDYKILDNICRKE